MSSTIFNPNIPTNDDSVYDAYFSFHNNMEAINNLIGIDHFSGTAAQFRGQHRQVSFAEALDADPQPTGDLAILFTRPSNSNTKSNAPILKFANRDGIWEIPLGAQQAPAPDPSPPTPQPTPTPTTGPEFNDGGTSGYVKFANKFGMVWVRGYMASKGAFSASYPIAFSRIFFGGVSYGTSSFSMGDTKRMIPPNYSIGNSSANATNRNETQGQSIQFLIIGAFA